jgi:hypothetical protein
MGKSVRAEIEVALLRDKELSLVGYYENTVVFKIHKDIGEVKLLTKIKEMAEWKDSEVKNIVIDNGKFRITSHKEN